MRDRSGFDLDGNGQIDRDPIGFAPGLSTRLHRRGPRLRQRRHRRPAGPVAAGQPARSRAATPRTSTTRRGPPRPATQRFTDSGEGHTDNYADPSSAGRQLAVPLRLPGLRRAAHDAATDVGPATSDGDLTGDVDVHDGRRAAARSTTGTATSRRRRATPRRPRTATADADDRPRPGEVRARRRRQHRRRDARTTSTTRWDFGNGGTTKDAAGVEVTTGSATPGYAQGPLTVTDAAGQPSDAVAGPRAWFASSSGAAPTG